MLSFFSCCYCAFCFVQFNSCTFNKTSNRSQLTTLMKNLRLLSKMESSDSLDSDAIFSTFVPLSKSISTLYRSKIYYFDLIFHSIHNVYGLIDFFPKLKFKRLKNSVCGKRLIFMLFMKEWMSPRKCTARIDITKLNVCDGEWLKRDDKFT